MGKRPKGVRIDFRRHRLSVQAGAPHAGRGRLPGLRHLRSNSLDGGTLCGTFWCGRADRFLRHWREPDHLQSTPEFGGVDKLAAVKDGDVYTPKIKISESVEKITTRT